MPKSVKRLVHSTTPLAQQLATLSLQQQRLQTAIAQDVLVDAAHRGPEPVPQGPVGMLRALAPASTVAACRTEHHIFDLPKVAGPLVCLERGAGEDALVVPAHAGQRAAWRQALGPSVATAVQVILARRCDTQTLRSLSRGSSAEAAQAAMRYLMGQVLRGRGLARLSGDEAAHQVLLQWLQRLVQVYHPGRAHLTVVASSSCAMTHEAPCVAVLSLDAEAYRIFVDGRDNPLCVHLRAEGRAVLTSDVTQEQHVLSMPILLLNKGIKIRGGEDAADAVMATMLARLRHETANDEAWVRLAALKVYGHLCLTAGQVRWLRMCMAGIEPSQDATAVMGQLMFTAVALGHKEAVQLFLDLGVSATMRCECFNVDGAVRGYYGEHCLQERSPTLLHAAASICGPSPKDRLAVVQLLLQHGADATALAASGDHQDTQIHQYMGTSPALHAVLAGHHEVAGVLTRAVQTYAARRRADLLPLLQVLARCANDMLMAHEAHDAERLAALERSYGNVLERLQWDHGLGQNDTQEIALRNSLFVGISRHILGDGTESPDDLADAACAEEDALSVARWQKTTGRAIADAMQTLVERHFEQVARSPQDAALEHPTVRACLIHAADALAQAQRAICAGPVMPDGADSCAHAEEEVQQAAREVAALGILTHFDNCRPLVWCVLAGDPNTLRAVVDLHARPFPPDLAPAYALTFSPARPVGHGPSGPSAVPKKHAQAMRAQLLRSATTPGAMVALMQVAAQLADVQAVRALMAQAVQHDALPWRHRGASVAVLAMTLAERAAEALGPFLHSCPDAHVLQEVLGHANDTGDTVFHVAARSGTRALKALLQVCHNSNAYCAQRNVSGHTAFEVALNLQAVRSVIVLVRAFPFEAAQKLTPEHLLGLHDGPLVEVLDALRAQRPGEAWLRAQLVKLVRKLESGGPGGAHRHTLAQRLRRRYARLDIDGLAPAPEPHEPAEPSWARVLPEADGSQDESHSPGFQQARRTSPDSVGLVLAHGSAAAREAAVTAWLSAHPETSASTKSTALAWRLVEALHITGSGQGMGRHYAAHAPSVPRPALRARALAYRLCAASRFGAHDAVALLHTRQRARQLMLRLPAQPLALFAVNLESQALAGEGFVAGDLGQEGAFYQNSRRVRFVMRHLGADGGIDFVAIYPVAPGDRRPLGVLKQL